MFIINEDGVKNDDLFPASHPCGTIPRDYNVQPVSMFTAPNNVPLIPRSEWDARIAEQDKTKSSTWHLLEQSGFRVLDQNGQGFCWFYSVVGSIMVKRCIAGLPYVRLSAHAGACKMNNFRDGGGWCGKSQEFITANGIPDVDHWKEQSMSRQYDTPETWANAKQYKIEQDVVDLTVPVYDRDLSVDLIATLLLRNEPVPTDWAEWSHSVCAVQLVKIESGSYGFKIMNSWGPSYGTNGYGVIRLDKWPKPMGAVATVGVTG